MIKGGEQVTKITFTLPWTDTIKDGSIAYYSGYFPNFAIGSYGLCIFVKSYADIGWSISGTHPTVRIGDATLLSAVSGPFCGTDAVYGDYIILLHLVGATVPIAHLPGAIVWKASSYSETSPATDSPVKVHGIINKDIQAAPNTSKADFEVAATNALLQGSQYYQKSTMMVSYYQWTYNRVREGNQLTGPAAIREGSRVSIVPYTGATAVQRQVVIWEFDGNSMIYKLTLGDYQKDVWNVLDKNTAASQKALI
jgi:hypothetical protein